jgi:hypothetical protein
MRIQVVGNGRVLAGTPKQIILQMKSVTPGGGHLTLREYVDHNVASIARGFGVSLEVTGETEEEIAASFLERMLEGGFVREC